MLCDMCIFQCLQLLLARTDRMQPGSGGAGGAWRGGRQKAVRRAGAPGREAVEPAGLLPEVRAVLRAGPAHPRDLARRLRGAPRGEKLPRMLANLEALGLARSLEGGRFTA